MEIILASQSPRRRQLLTLLNIPFSTEAVNADEDSIQLTNLQENVKKRAILKATTLYKRTAHNEQLILAADTAVSLHNKMLNKPNGQSDAKQMLQSLSGQAHEVHTGVALILPNGQEPITFVETAVVQMRPFTENEIDAYIATGDPMDKAGAYAIQHPTFQPVHTLHGCYFNVMGLPICQLIIKLKQIGVLPLFNHDHLKAAHHLHENCPYFEKL